MEQENRRLKANLIKAEKARIGKLVHLANENDPRVVAHFKKIEEEKQRKKLERKQAKEKQRQEEEDKRRLIREAEEAKKREIEEKERQEKEEKLRRQNRKKEIEEKMRNVVMSRLASDKCDKYYLDEVVFKLKEDEMVAVTEGVEKGLINSRAKLDSLIQKFIATRNLPEKKTLIKEVKPTKADWTQQEVNLLQKGVMKFPPGVYERWKRISEYVGGRFNEQECADKTKMLKTQHIKELQKKEEPSSSSQPHPQPQPQTEGWSQVQQKSLEAAIKKHPASLPALERWEKIAQEVEGKNMKECVARFKELKERLKAKN